MQIAAHVLAYNVSRFIRPVLRNMEPFVDKIYVAHSTRPFAYVPGVRESRMNPTTVEEIRAVGLGSKLEIVEGDWLLEESMRNDCLKRAKAEGFDWLITQDADEFYTEQSWEQLRATLIQRCRADHYVTPWLNFWKSSQYVLLNADGEMKQTNASFALRCGSPFQFVSRRQTNAAQSRVIDCPCYHYGYVMSDEEMLEKISTWSHAREVRAVKQWFRNKWLNWRESTRYLHPTSPVSWLRAIRFPHEQPAFAAQFALAISAKQYLSAGDTLGNCIYDAKAELLESVHQLKPFLRATLQSFGAIR
jgi:hypothetical protein